MKSLLKCASIVLLFALVSGCQQIPKEAVSSAGGVTTASYDRVTADSIGSLVGKKLELNGNNISLSEDGTFSGTWKNVPIAGTWEMKDDYFCRVLTEFHNSDSLGSEDCQLWELKENSVRGTRDRGNGSSFIYAIK